MGESFTIAPASGNGQALVLGDDANTSPREIILAPPWLPAPEIELQTWHPVRAKEKVTVARGGAFQVYVWKVARHHASTGDAEAFKKAHPRAVVDGFSLGQFRLTHVSFGNSMISIGAIKTPRCIEQVGSRTVFEYTWHGTPFS